MFRPGLVPRLCPLPQSFSNILSFPHFGLGLGRGLGPGLDPGLGPGLDPGLGPGLDPGLGPGLGFSLDSKQCPFLGPGLIPNPCQGSGLV